jgi:hypothetical protein
LTAEQLLRVIFNKPDIGVKDIIAGQGRIQHDSRAHQVGIFTEYELNRF